MKNTAGESMTKSLVTIGAHEPIALAAEKMEEKRIRHLPVTDKTGLVIGILSDRDVKHATNPRRPGFAPGLLVSEFMSWPAVTVDESTPVRDLAEGMITEKISAFLVTRNGKEVVGIVTTEDLLRFLCTLLEEKKSALESLPYNPVVREMMQELQSVGI